MAPFEHLNEIEQGNPDLFRSDEHFPEEQIAKIEEARHRLGAVGSGSFTEVRNAAKAMLSVLGSEYVSDPGRSFPR